MGGDSRDRCTRFGRKLKRLVTDEGKGRGNKEVSRFSLKHELSLFRSQCRVL